MNIPEGDINEWIGEFEPYQTNTIASLLECHAPEEAMSMWLSANGPSLTMPFGGSTEKTSEAFLDTFKTEFKKFICGDEEYAEERAKLRAEGPVAKSLFISVISAAIGATLGYTATLLAPAVAIMLHTVTTVGLKAWCKAN